MIEFIAIVLGLAIAFGGGWYCNGKFGAKIAADVAVAKDAAAKL